MLKPQSIYKPIRDNIELFTTICNTIAFLVSCSLYLIPIKFSMHLWLLSLIIVISFAIGFYLRIIIIRKKTIQLFKKGEHVCIRNTGGSFFVIKYHWIYPDMVVCYSYNAATNLATKMVVLQDILIPYNPTEKNIRISRRNNHTD